MHESTEQHDRMLRGGRIALLIDQDPESQALCALQQLVHANAEGPAPVHLQPRFHLVTAHNLPAREI